MSLREETARLRHMLDHAREAVVLITGKTREDLDSDRLLNLALVRLVEICRRGGGAYSQADVDLVPADSLARDCQSSQSTHSRLRFHRFRYSLGNRQPRSARADTTARKNNRVCGEEVNPYRCDSLLPRTSQNSQSSTACLFRHGQRKFRHTKAVASPRTPNG